MPSDEGNLVDFWMVRTRTIAPWAEIERVLPRHLTFETELAERGDLLLAGPFIDAEGSFTGDGLFILATRTEGEARDLAAQDPFVVDGLREVVAVERWSVRRVGVSVPRLRSEDFPR
jgi:uncharacterized protein YciI